jgi:predicted transcriptional regulator
MDEHRISQDILGLLQNKTETASVLAEQSKINSKMLNKVLMRLLDEEKIIFHNNKYSIRK